MSKNEKKAKSSCFVAQVDTSLASKLKIDLQNFDFEFSKPAYTIFSAKKKGISVTLYESGKLMVQGKEMGEFIEFYLEPEILRAFNFSHPEEYVDTTPHIGCDEAGKGDFFGPLCIAAVYGSTDDIKRLLKLGIRDTKKITDKRTLDLAKQIKDSTAHHIIKIGPEKYNELYYKFKNLNALLSWGHATAIEQLSEKTGCKKVLIDQFAKDAFIRPIILKKNKDLDLVLKTHAESDVLVASAAILARSTFLYALKDLGDKFEIELPKGASDKTKEVAISIVKKHGPEALATLCKKHFQTYEQVLEKC